MAKMVSIITLSNVFFHDLPPFVSMAVVHTALILQLVSGLHPAFNPLFESVVSREELADYVTVFSNFMKVLNSAQKNSGIAAGIVEINRSIDPMHDLLSSNNLASGSFAGMELAAGITTSASAPGALVGNLAGGGGGEQIQDHGNAAGYLDWLSSSMIPSFSFFPAEGSFSAPN
ncbi:hypothetical protein HK405_010129 [Cladochytrium tenue]|nr:hypothetical protein HK405_010129 [Cladochytrium tenue]